MLLQSLQSKRVIIGYDFFVQTVAAHVMGASRKENQIVGLWMCHGHAIETNSGFFNFFGQNQLITHLEYGFRMQKVKIMFVGCSNRSITNAVKLFKTEEAIFSGDAMNRVSTRSSLGLAQPTAIIRITIPM